MTESYVTQLINLYEIELKKLIEMQNPEIANALSLVALQIGHLEQARDKCKFDDQLYAVNRIARMLGEIAGHLEEKEKAACSD
jgi:hypothetical protein